MADMTEVEALARLSAAGKEVSVSKIGDNGVPFTIDGNGDIIRLEDVLAEPLRIKADRMFTSIDSFVEYVAKFKASGSVIFASIKDDTLTAEIDSHEPGKPSRITHKAKLKLEKTLAAKAWITGNNKRMTQADFAEFVEDNAADIADPAPAIMIEVAHHMQAAKNASFESKVDLDNGSFVFRHNEEVKGMRKDGTTEVPATFKIALTVYRGQTQPFSLDARLRYRIDDGMLVMWYVIPTIERLLELAFDDVVKQVSKGTSINVLHGA